jgi:hypothetical protein
VTLARSDRDATRAAEDSDQRSSGRDGKHELEEPVPTQDVSDVSWSAS